MVLSEENNNDTGEKREDNVAIIVQTGRRKVFFHQQGAKNSAAVTSSTFVCRLYECLGSLTICGQEEMCSVLLRQPSDLIDLLFNLQTLKVVKLRLVALECAVDIVLSLGEWLCLSL